MNRNELVDAVNTAFDEQDRRTAVRKRLLALALTLATFVVGILAVVMIAVLPGVAGHLKSVIIILRWPFLGRIGAVLVTAALAFVLIGGLTYLVTSQFLDLAGSLLFSLYVSSFGRFQATYGSLASIVILLLWLFLTALAIIVGAELNAELERQTVKDTTTGLAAPLGERAAYAADTVAVISSQPDEVAPEQL